MTALRGCEPRGARASAGRQFPGARRLMPTGSDDGPLAHGRPLTELELTTSSAGRSRARLKRRSGHLRRGGAVSRRSVRSGAVSRRSVWRRAAGRAAAWHVPGAPLCRRRGPGPGFRLGPGHPLPAGQALRAKSSCAALLAGAAAAASGRWQIFGAAGG